LNLPKTEKKILSIKNNDKIYMVGSMSLKPGWEINLTWDMKQARKNVIKKLGNS
jgi:hypothetical protein